MKKLTKREYQIYNLIIKGWSNKEISKSLGISEKTIKVHTTNIFKKMIVNSRNKLIVKHYEGMMGVKNV